MVGSDGTFLQYGFQNSLHYQKDWYSGKVRLGSSFFHNLVLKAPKSPDLRLIFVLAVNVAIGSVWLGSFRERDQER